MTTVHALIHELSWRPQYAVGRSIGRSEAGEVTFRSYNDELFSIIVLYDARLVERLTDADIIDAVSGVYGPATLPRSSPPPAATPRRTGRGGRRAEEAAAEKTRATNKGEFRP